MNNTSSVAYESSPTDFDLIQCVLTEDLMGMCSENVTDLTLLCADVITKMFEFYCAVKKVVSAEYYICEKCGEEATVGTLTNARDARNVSDFLLSGVFPGNYECILLEDGGQISWTCAPRNISVEDYRLKQDTLLDLVRYDWTFLFVVVFILAGGLGNILVCLAVLLDRRLQNVTNYFLLSLAIADLLVSLFVMPLGAIPGFLGKILKLRQYTIHASGGSCLLF